MKQPAKIRRGEKLRCAVLALAQRAAPDAATAHAFESIAAAAERDGETENDIALRLVRALEAGLAYGNWPRG